MLAGVLLSVFALADASSLHPEGVVALGVASKALTLAGCCTFGLGLPAMLLLDRITRNRVACFFGISHFFCFGGLALGILGGYLLTTNDPVNTGNAALFVVGTAGLLACLASMPFFDRLLPRFDAKEPKAIEQADDTEFAPSTMVTTPSAGENADTSASAVAGAKARTVAGETEGEAPVTNLTETVTPPATPPALSPTPRNESKTPEESAALRAAAPEPEEPETDDTKPPQTEPPRDAISPTEAIAHDFNLSRREHEVLCYLAHGRNAAFIQQELLISIYTVKTHIANIYGKIGAHSIQDVIDLVEAYSSSPEPPDARKTATTTAASASRKEKPLPKGSSKQEKTRHDVA